MLNPFQIILGNYELTLTDVGASYFLPDTWQFLTSLDSSKFVLVDPNGQNLNYIKSYPKPTFITIPHALSKTGGLRTLYLSNTDSGSSLYPPINRSWERQENQSYLFPMRLLEIETLSLSEALDNFEVGYIDSIKLDTQGTELEIIMGLDSDRWKNLLFIEMEVTLQNPPHHQGASRLYEVQSYLERKGFSLANIRTSRRSPSTDSGITIPVECDVLFVRDIPEILKRKNPKIMAHKSIALACAYYLHDFAKVFTSKVWRNEFQLDAKDCERLNVAINTIANIQTNYLSKQGLSLWHRDGS